MNSKEKIKDLFFNHSYTQTEIAEELGVSNQYVSKILKTDSRYLEIKKQRQNENEEKNKSQTKDYIKKQRKIKQHKNNVDDLVLRNMHNQASAELSQPRKMTNMAFRNWNKSAYTYNDKKRRFEFREELGRAADVPKYIKVEVL